jgi:hypothetical protein
MLPCYQKISSPKRFFLKTTLKHAAKSYITPIILLWQAIQVSSIYGTLSSDDIKAPNYTNSSKNMSKAVSNAKKAKSSPI